MLTQDRPKAILTLPVSHLIDGNNHLLFTGIKALEYKFPQTVFAKYLPRLFHSCHGVAWKGFLDYFDTISGYLNVNRFKIFSFDLGPAVSSTKTGPNQYPAGEPIGAPKFKAPDQEENTISQVQV